jgi:signal transduction histidine kinase
VDKARKYNKLLSEMKALRAKLADAGLEKARHDGLLSEVRAKLAEAEKGLEDAQMEAQRKADMLAMITHDLKSPMTSILGYAELITTKDSIDADTLAMTEVIYHNGNKALGLIEDFLTFSRIESGKMQLKAVPEDVCRILAEGYEDFSVTAKKKGITFRTSACELPLTMIDKKHFQRVIANLLQNAFNYTGKGGSVTLTAEDGKKLEGFITIAVSDTGPGISKEDQDKIFDKYYQVRKTSRTKGSGLGLAIVKAVTEAHGGRVELISAPGKGSTFKLHLPVRSEWPAGGGVSAKLL